MQNQVGRSLDADLSGGVGKIGGRLTMATAFPRRLPQFHDDRFCHWPLRRAFSTIVAWFG